MAKLPKAQIELFKADTSWFHIFKELIRSGTWAKMSAAAKALYPVIKAFTNQRDGRSFPSIDTLVEYSGVSRPTVIRALKELQELGYVRRDEKGSGRRTNLYHLVERLEVTDAAGEPTGQVIAWDYVSSITPRVTQEIKNYIAQGMTEEGKLQYIHIEKLVVNVAGRDIVSGNQVNFHDDQYRALTSKWVNGELSDAEYRRELASLDTTVKNEQ